MISRKNLASIILPNRADRTHTETRADRGPRSAHGSELSGSFEIRLRVNHRQNARVTCPALLADHRSQGPLTEREASVDQLPAPTR
jgi:hypothetical protein